MQELFQPRSFLSKFNAALKDTYVAGTQPCCLYATADRIVYDERGRYVHLEGCERQTLVADINWKALCLRMSFVDHFKHGQAPRVQSWTEMKDYWKRKGKRKL